MIKVKTLKTNASSNRVVVEMTIPEDWYHIILDYQKTLGHKTVDQTIELILMDYINDKEVERKKNERKKS